ncbi:unnamed protein product [Miscanthus lutarioriparius]|uniref:DUF4378 domain-containing protein n=1 Tax=Miscanthus lutarioriparius TaxID=422564 RepID=A0A811R358_9POAL|nr:unnamed protein product [Miscanthus lutarioriparius]
MRRRTKQSSSSSFWYSSRSRSSSAPATPRPEPAAAKAGEPPVGCMSMVHYLIFAPGTGRPPTSSNAIVTAPHDCHGLGGGDSSHRRGDDNSSKSGFEAPRNSLDLDADNPNDTQIGVQIEPVFDALASRTTTSMRRSTKPTAPSSEAETPRTPSLVARLMGIDGLPDQQQPSPAPAQHKKPGNTGRRSSTTSTAGAGKENSSSCSPPASKAEKKKRVIPESMNRREPLRSLSCNVGVAEARSLPDTPRASTSARASWDGPRLSLQALKENVLDRAAHYMSMPSSPTSLSAASGKKKKKKDPACSHRRRDERAAANEHAREILRQAKETVASRKSSKNSTSASPAVEKRQSCFNNKENVMMSSPAAPAPAMEDAKLPVVVQVQETAKPTTVAPKPSAEHHHSPRVAALAPRLQQQPSPPPPLDPPPTRARKPDGCERFATRIKKPAACPASSPSTSSSTTDCCSAAAAARARVSSSSPLEEDPEYSYLRTVLERGGFMRSSPPHRRPGRGHSVASPVDPIVFHLLELELPADEARLGPLRHRWNRKLLFHLAQELLADLLLGLDASSTAMTTGLPLLGKVWKRVQSFPAADCRVVGDIDALVAADLESSNVRRLARHPAVEEEAGDVAEEVADRVLDALLAQCVAESVSLSCAAHAQSHPSSS